jgi:hypothetical protein
MDSSRKFTDDNLQGEELEAFTEKFLKAKFDRDRKRRWSEILEEKHDIAPPGSERHKRKARTIYLWLGTAAAVIALLLFIYPAYLQSDESSYQELADNYLQQEFFQNHEVSKGEIDIEQLSLNAATAYNSKEFEMAIDNYEKIIALGAGKSEHIFFLGLSYLYNQNYPKAIEMLSSLKDDPSGGIFENETNWFLAIAYLKNKNPGKAKPLLMEVKKSQWNNQEVSRLLQLLE